MLNVLRVL